MVIGYAMDDNDKTPLISAALRHAAEKQELTDRAIFHSDRGSNYTSFEFAATVADPQEAFDEWTELQVAA